MSCHLYFICKLVSDLPVTVILLVQWFEIASISQSHVHFSHFLKGYPFPALIMSGRHVNYMNRAPYIMSYSSIN